MTSFTHTYPDSSAKDDSLKLRERTGGRKPRRSDEGRNTLYERISSYATAGSHMPLETELHWQWANPLNIIPAFIALLLVIALVALAFAG